MKSVLAAIVLFMGVQAQAVPMDLVTELINGKKSNVVSEALKGMKVTSIIELETQRCRGCYKVEIIGTQENGQEATLEVQSTFNPNGGYNFQINANSNETKLGKDLNKVFGAVLTKDTEKMVKTVAGVSNYNLIELQPQSTTCPECTLYHFVDGDRIAAVQFVVSGGMLQVGVRKIK